MLNNKTINVADATYKIHITIVSKTVPTWKVNLEKYISTVLCHNSKV